MIPAKTNASTRSEIERLLWRSLVPRTGNRDALIELGFSPAYPHFAHDSHYGSLWTRAIDTRAIDAQSDPIVAHRSHARTLVIERAHYVRADPVSRPNKLRRVAAGAAPIVGDRVYRPLSASRVFGPARVERRRDATGSSSL